MEAHSAYIGVTAQRNPMNRRSKFRGYLIKRVVLLSLVLFVTLDPLFGQSYVQVIKPEVKILLEPSASSETVSQAKNGNIFELMNKKDSWFEIVMFSGEFRYIDKFSCKEINYTLSLPESEQFRTTVFLAILNAEDKAQLEANEKYPKDIYKNINYARLLNDRYKLEVLNQFDIQPPIYSKIILEGIKKKWDR